MATIPKLTPQPTKSYWHTRDLFSKSGSLPVVKEVLKKHTTDVCIVGSGIAGCSLAYHLSRLNKEVGVTLIDGRHIAGGATGRNGGLLWPCLNASFKKLVATKGEAAARDIMEFEGRACAATAAFVHEHDGMKELTEFSYFKEGGIYLTESEAEFQNELEELALMQSMGFSKDLDVWDAAHTNKMMQSVGYHGAIRYPKVGKVWAARLALGIAQEATKAANKGKAGRLVIANDAEAVTVEEVGAKASSLKPSDIGLARPAALTVKTARGDEISARVVVHCTNAYSAVLLPELQGKLQPVRNQVVVTSPLRADQQMLDVSVYAREGYVYWSPRADGALVLGGFRDTVPNKEVGNNSDSDLDPKVSQCIRNYLPQHFPQKFTLTDPVFEMEWAGILGFTEDRFPLVGLLPSVPEPTNANKAANRAGQYICAGFSGHGMTRAFSAAEGLARTLLDMPQGVAALPAAFLPQGRM